MKYIVAFLLLSSFLNTCGGKNNTTKNDRKTEANKAVIVYKIIQKTYYPRPELNDSTEIPGVVDSLVISELNEPMKALAAFYSAMGGTMCNGENCDLTSALGLGKQGSEEHKDLIKKYFPQDKVAETVIKQDCYLRPSGASSFSDFEYLTIKKYEDTIEVDYNLMHYNYGDIEWIKGPDLYVFSNNTFKKVRRNLWTHIEE